MNGAVATIRDLVTGETDEPEIEAPGVDEQAVFVALKNERRRFAMEILADGGMIPLGDLAREVAARETDTNPEDVPSNVRKSVYITFLQAHLETLEDANIVRTDDRGTMVYRGSEFERAYEALESVRETFGFGGDDA